MDKERKYNINKSYKLLQIKNKQRALRRDTYVSVSNIVLSVLGITLAILLIFNLYKSAIGRDPISFTGTLNWLSTFDVGFSIPDLSSSVTRFVIQSDWFTFNFIRDFINLFGTIFGVVYYLVLNLVYTITFAGKFIWYILG